MTYKVEYKRGFGIVEVIIASTIIIIILAALVFMSRSILDNAQYSSSRFQALSFAQGEIEKIRQKRDTNYLDGNPNTKWYSFLESSPNLMDDAALEKFYNVDPQNPTFLLREISNPDSILEYSFRTYNDKRYYPRVKFAKIVDTNKGLLSEPSIIEDATLPAYKVTVEVLWFEKQEFTGATPNINSMNKVSLSEIITDNRPGY